MRRGYFITLEGADGCGTTTQSRLLQEYLEQQGYEVVWTREPGSIGLGQRIRELLLYYDGEVAPRCEAFLFLADRSQNIEHVIKPAVAEGKIVICDRFVDSSAVYQGIARGMGIDLVYEVNRYAIGKTMPDITILLDIPGSTGIQRKKKQGELDRMELETASFHDKVSEGYRILAEKFPERIKKLDGTQPIEVIFDQIKEIVKNIIQ